MSHPIISVDNISKKYTISHRASYGTLRDSLTDLFTKPFRKIDTTSQQEEFWALKDINFTVQPGERIGIIGRNGAGKSTLLKILSQITSPTTGQVTLRGRVASLLEVGTGFHPELTGRENVYLNGAILGMKQSEIKKKFDEIVAFAEIDKFLDTPVKRYSSGMYVRLAFAVAAHLESEILIIDEVLAVGDMQFQKKCLSKMEDVAEHGRTIIYVSHNLPSVQALCTRAILLDKGQMQTIGQPAEVVKKYIGEISLLSHHRWPAGQRPKNNAAEICAVSICDQAGQKIERPTTDQPIFINIDYNVLAPNASIGFTVNLFDESRNHIFSSINNHESNWYGKPMPSGQYRSVCEIPGDLLNEGHFTISLALFGNNFSDLVSFDDIVGFTVLDGINVRGDYFGGFGGAIRPLLQWKTTSII